MKWYDEITANDDVVISTRVRLARNIKETPFPQRLDNDLSKRVALSVKQALDSNYHEKLTYTEIDKSSIKKSLVEEHVISPEFAEENGIYKALITDESGNLSIMINEEDHIRIQAIYGGFNLDKAFEKANEADDAISKGCDIAFDEKLGYLTSCPTNLGTGMRVSAMLHLPAITAFGYMKSLVGLMNKIGLTVRGMYGEGSDSMGNMYQISNRVTLGISEEDTLAKMKNAIENIVQREREARKKLFEASEGENLDKLWRSYGTLKFARKIDTAEATKLISNVRLAQSCKIISESSDKNLVKLMFEIMPNHIAERFPDAVNSSKRDKYRADIIREYLL